MSRFVALLRGIGPANPNMRNAKLREVFETLGFMNVKTVISSGNVLFDTPNTDKSTLEAVIEEALPTRLGFTSSVIIRNSEDWRQLVTKKPFKGYFHNNTTYLTVTFLKHAQNMQATLQTWPDDKAYKLVAAYKGEVCCVTDLTATKTPDVMLYLEKQLGKQITTRTWKTVERIGMHLIQ